MLFFVVFLPAGISFTPHETGTHMVNVYKDGEHIANSPFKINVTRNEVGNADQVKVYGDALTSGTANEENEFYVDTRDAGTQRVSNKRRNTFVLR